ncbi:LutC/YkgG family protein [Lacipirellula sp.]|uniref:LutC/YkgG family protein n=1 Tax=Lacipirellula sp. TaxID=2691419 RepID=UPI003D11819C
MSSAARDQILRDIRRSLPADALRPSLDGDWVRYADPYAQFFETLRGVGGAGRIVVGEVQLREEVERVIESIGAKEICSVVPAAAGGNVDLAAVDDPHQLAGVDLAVLPGELAVAENAAVWVTNAQVGQRVAYFLSQHVVLVVPHDRIVNNMHEAYEWLHRTAGPAGPFAAATWGTFMSGPSKTADIEQALVIGAHGARSLHVFLLKP